MVVSSCLNKEEFKENLKGHSVIYAQQSPFIPTHLPNGLDLLVINYIEKTEQLKVILNNWSGIASYVFIRGVSRHKDILGNYLEHPEIMHDICFGRLK